MDRLAHVLSQGPQRLMLSTVQAADSPASCGWIQGSHSRHARTPTRLANCSGIHLAKALDTAESGQSSATCLAAVRGCSMFCCSTGKGDMLLSASEGSLGIRSKASGLKGEPAQRGPGVSGLHRLHGRPLLGDSAGHQCALLSAGRSWQSAGGCGS